MIKGVNIHFDFDNMLSKSKWIFSRSPVKGTKFISPVIIDLDCT